MTRIQYRLPYLLYFCGSVLFCLHLNRWTPFVEAAQPSSAKTERRLTDVPPSSGRGSSSRRHTEVHADRGHWRGKATAATGTSATAPLPLPTARNRTLRLLRSSLDKRSRFKEIQSLVAALYGPGLYEMFKALWCTGPGFPISELRDVVLPLPSFPDVIKGSCRNWMTAVDLRGREKVLWSAQIASQRHALQAIREESNTAALQNVLLPGSTFSVDMIDSPGSVDFKGATFKRGHMVTNGTFGLVMVVRVLRNAAQKGALKDGPAESMPHPAEQVECAGAQAPAVAPHSTASSPSSGATYLEKTTSLQQSLPTELQVAARTDTGPSEEPEAVDATEQSEGDVDTCTPAGGSLASSEVNRVEKVLQGDEVSAASEEDVRSTAASEASMASAQTSFSSPAHVSSQFRNQSEVFLKELSWELANRQNLDTIYAAKMGLSTLHTFPPDLDEREQLADKIIATRLNLTRRILSLMPVGFTPQQLYKSGFVLPLATVRLQGRRSHLDGFDNDRAHLLNFIQIMYPQLTDIFDLRLRDSEALLYMVKRVIQLGAHLAAAKLVHMDIKRENVGVSPTGELTLLDFDEAQREGTIFECRRKPTIQFAAPEVCRKVVRSGKTFRTQRCVAHRTLDSWDLGILIFELVCSSDKYFPCYEPRGSLWDKIKCISSLKPPSAGEPGDGLSPTRAPVNWGSCRPPRKVQAVIYGLLDLNPEKRLDALKLFVYSDLFRFTRSEVERR